MSFEICEPGAFKLAEALPEGWVSIDGNGTMRIYAEDLALVKIKDAAAVLVDVDTKRIGLRAPREGDKPFRVSSCPGGKRDGRQRRTVSVRVPLRKLGLAPKKVKGRYELQTQKDLMWFVLESAAIAADDGDDQDKD